jgi:hypothetical protein
MYPPAADAAGYPTQPQASPPRNTIHLTVSSRTITALIVVGILTAAVGVALYIAVRAWEDALALTTQNKHLQGQVTSLQGQVSSLKGKEKTDYMTVGNLLAPVLPLTTTVCSTDLTGVHGPATYWFACSDKNPASPQSSTG